MGIIKKLLPINRRNNDLYNELKVNFDFNYKISFLYRDTWAVRVAGNKVFMNIPILGLICREASSLTHELFHVYIKYKGFDSHEYIHEKLRVYKGLNILFSIELISVLSNLFDHIIMLKHYHKLGFPKNKFISDFSTPKFTEQDFIKLVENYDNNKFNFFNLFVGKYFAMMSCSNTKFDYSNYYEKMRSVDFVLFNILETFYFKWKEVQMETAKENSYLINNLFSDLDGWRVNNSITV